MSNSEVAEIALQHYPGFKAEQAANRIVTKANLLWKKEGLTITDDITCVVVYIERKYVLNNIMI
jgi:hypothetical protein